MRPQAKLTPTLFTLALHSNSNDKKLSIAGGLSLSCSNKRKDFVQRTFCSAETCTYPADAIKSDSDIAEEKIGVMLLNLGGPDTLNDVQPFLFNLFADPDIIRLPRLFRFLQRPLAQLISVLRASKSKEGYAAIGGGSPLLKITNEQASALKSVLEAKEVPVDVYVAMRYWHPFTEEAVHQVSHKNKNREGYIKSMADLIEKELQIFENPEEAMIFFSAHGVPVSYVEDAGDPYKDQMEECIFLIMQELKSRGVKNNYTLAYQSRVGPVQWLKPYTDEVLVELGQQGVKSLLAVPVSFVSEHIETLEEIDMEYKELAVESGIVNWGRVPALNCTSSFITDLADAVIEALPSAVAISTTSNTKMSEEADGDVVGYAIKMLFGSFMAFILLLSPKLMKAFKNHIL
ncbi:hypothetical protein RD792_001711 [Penstemon davidsonii]|uniref:Ferrochelatase n=1 Tax=Penstemon davidsonii TaxID=160366 RepID=A0ABR0DPX8_9LAMI|nr:hypothetical protein RD792_001711 [Penstemon davidsonii]